MIPGTRSRRRGSIPTWATPDAWKRAEETVRLAKRRYRAIPQGERPRIEKAHAGGFIVIGCYVPLRFAIGKTEQQADEAFRRRYPRTKRAGLLEIPST